MSQSQTRKTRKTRVQRWADTTPEGVGRARAAFESDYTRRARRLTQNKIHNAERFLRSMDDN